MKPTQPEAYCEFDPYQLESTPAFVIDLQAVERNARTIYDVQTRSGGKILHALKGFSMFAAFPRMVPYFSGTTSSGLNEALLAREFFPKEIHVYSPAFKAFEVEMLCGFAHTLVFNSLNQWKRFRPVLEASERRIEAGLRLNHGYAEVQVELYNPCAAGSRLGIPVSQVTPDALEGIDGLHFHSLCEQGAEVLERTLEAFRKTAEPLFSRIKWLNFGGGHHITQPHYNRDLLVSLIAEWRSRYGLDIYLEPGEAVANHTGVLVAEVQDIIENRGIRCAILDTSATAHMPDVLEMPYRPEIIGAGDPGDYPECYRLGGLTCLAGDVIGDYSFPEPLVPGQRLVFKDMSHYTMVKTTTFNGVPHPDIVCLDRKPGDASPSLSVARRFHYSDFRNRLS